MSEPYPPFYIGRLHYLAALQAAWPEFWYDLRQLVETLRNVDPKKLEGLKPITSPDEPVPLLEPFFAKYGVRERWLKSACLGTALDWLLHPSSAAAMLDPDVTWYRYGADMTIPPFAPRGLGFEAQFSNPYLLRRYSGDDPLDDKAVAKFRKRTMAEFNEQFRKRAHFLPLKKARAIRAQFQAELDRYVDAMKACLLEKPETPRHAEWAVLRRRGYTDQQIVEMMARHGMYHSDDAVKKARVRLEESLRSRRE